MKLLKEKSHLFGCGLVALAITLFAVVFAAPTPAMADEQNEPVVLTPDTHSFIGYPHHREPWPNEDGSPVEYPFIVEDDRIDVEFGMEADDSAAPHGYVLWQLFDETGKEVFSAYLMGFGYGYASNGFGFVLDAGTYTQRLTQVGCEGTQVNISLIAYTDPDTWVWPGPRKAQSITVGSTVDGKLTDSYDVTLDGNETATRYFKDFQFELDEPTDIKVTALPRIGEARLSLLDSEGNLLRSALSVYDEEQDSPRAITLDCGTLAAGTHYLRYEATEGPDGNPSAQNREFNLSTQAGRAVYRMYNPYTGEHFFTTSADERDSTRAYGWDYEGVLCVTPITSDYPIYRLYNPNNGDHMYTASQAEYDKLESLGWQKEDVAFYSVDDPAAKAESFSGVAIERFFNPYSEGGGSHHFVNSDVRGQAESKQLAASGWNEESTGWTAIDVLGVLGLGN